MRKTRSVFMAVLLLSVLLFTNLPALSQTDAKNVTQVIQIVCAEEGQILNNGFTCLFSNGSIRFFPDDTGLYRQKPFDAGKFTDLTMIAMGDSYLAGLKKDGTVVVEGGDIPVESLKNIVSIRANATYLYAIAKDGTIYKGNPSSELFNMEGEIVDVMEGSMEKMENLEPVVDYAPSPDFQTGIAVHKDGTVTIIEDSNGDFSDASNWKDITQVSVGHEHAAGLKANGTVVAVGSNENNQLDVGGWKDIVQVAVTYDETIGLKKDGTLVVAGGEIPKEFSGKKIIQIDSNGSLYKALTIEGDILFCRNPLNSWKEFYTYVQKNGDPSAVSSWANDSVQQARERKIVTDEILSMYKKDITREEVCEIAVKLYQALSGKEIEEPTESPFSDTYNEEIIKAYNLKIVSGIGNNQFGPELKVTREQIAVMFYNTIKAALPDEDIAPKAALSFSDANSISSWAVTPLTYMNEKGIITGVGGNLLSPAGNATREQAIVMINRVYNLFQ